MGVNYQKELERIIDGLHEGERPALMLHSCCAPCSSYVLEYLSEYFRITVLYYNPNIYPETEFYKREAEQIRLVNELPSKNKISVMKQECCSDEFYEAVKGLEDVKEGGERCFACFRLRLERTARLAKELGIEGGECTADMNFSLEACRCVGACGLAPVIMINDEVYGRLVPDDVPKILAKYKEN
jgi:(2Fe-2S) ferredoxin